jgi:hypothetical protein
MYPQHYTIYSFLSQSRGVQMVRKSPPSHELEARYSTEAILAPSLFSFETPEICDLATAKIAVAWRRGVAD